MRSDDKSIAKEGAGDPEQPRPVFKYFEDPKPEHPPLRHCTHAYTLVGEEGTNDSIQESSTVTQFDRTGSKRKTDCAMVDPEERKVEDLPPGRTEFVGWTTKTDEEIQKKGVELTGSDSYSIYMNNCADFAERLSDSIATSKGDERQADENISTNSLFNETTR